MTHTQSLSARIAQLEAERDALPELETKVDALDRQIHLLQRQVETARVRIRNGHAASRLLDELGGQMERVLAGGDVLHEVMTAPDEPTAPTVTEPTVPA
uniref:hypothetical protein n=1 Tax=uncultured Deinococcus sp. TaxID=158789 RepID=UPI0025E16457